MQNFEDIDSTAVIAAGTPYTVTEDEISVDILSETEISFDSGCYMQGENISLAEAVKTYYDKFCMMHESESVNVRVFVTLQNPAYREGADNTVRMLFTKPPKVVTALDSDAGFYHDMQLLSKKVAAADKTERAAKQVKADIEQAASVGGTFSVTTLGPYEQTDTSIFERRLNLMLRQVYGIPPEAITMTSKSQGLFSEQTVAVTVTLS